MKLVKFLFRSSPRMLLFTIVTAAVSGACNAGLIALINEALGRAETGLPAAFAIGFCALVVGRLLSTLISAIVLARFSQENIAALRCGLVRKIIGVPLRKFEQIGAGRVMAVLTEDVMNIAQALLCIPTFAVNIAILLCGGAYLAWLSPSMLMVLAAFILVGALGYRLLIVSGFRFLVLARDEEDRLFGHFRALTEGIKELKLHRERRGEFLGKNIRSVTDAYQRHNVAAEVRFAVAHAWNHLLVLGLLGLIIFVLPLWQPVSMHALTGYVVTTLYLMGPLAGVMGSLSVFGRAAASYAKAEQLGLSLTGPAPEPDAAVRPEARSFERLELVGVTHSYHLEKNDSNFMLGPVSLTFHPGELVFLVGGNGSGKTTLAKIITGLYPPEGGGIRIDGQPVTDANRDDYRQLFSAVFSDFHLFENLLGLPATNLDTQAREYLKQLHLEHKVRIADGVLSTTSLSQGQRKRLALLTAYLEDRPFYLFDEWAADQDPLFKEIFYTQMLPELKSRGKTVLVITHDDSYFHLADRLLKLDYGQIGSDRRRDLRACDPVLQD